MSEKEYIVILNKGVDYDAFWNQIENASDEDGFVPSRRVDIVNNRDGSLRSCHYALTDDEAAQLKNDPRVYDVEIPPQQRTDIVISNNAIIEQISDLTNPLYGKRWAKEQGSTSGAKNWGLLRCIYDFNFFRNVAYSSLDYPYTYSLDGTGVDVVIQDSGLQIDHPEFTDAEGNSRVQQINWYTESGLSGTQSANHYRDYHGHGTHCAGIAAGKTFGWAKNARIYSVKVDGLEGTGDEGNGISITDCFDVIKLWHRNKPVDPVTGKKRPTIVNMSWGYSGFYTTVSSMNWRGNTITNNVSSSTTRLNFGLVPLFNGFYYRTNVRISSVDTDIEELIDEGVHVCIAAGNNYHKIDVPGGDDYNNYAVTNNGTIYYHRGSSPYSTRAFNVGNVDVRTNLVSYPTYQEKKNQSSECGPGTDIYAPGTYIMSANSQITAFTSTSYTGPYFENTNYKQMCISGTSMASPQVCGVGALMLQAFPGLTPAELKQKILDASVPGIMYDIGDGGLNNYDEYDSLMNGNDRYLYMPYKAAEPYRASNLNLQNFNIRNR